MSFFSKPNITTSVQTSEKYQTTFVDILYDHERYLRENDGMIATPIPEMGKKVAVIGSGPAGLIAAFQLIKSGVDVEILEADENRYGGRVFSHHPIESEAAIFEMGAMRVPPSEKLFYFYAGEFNMQSSEFPDPGKVNTSVVFDGKQYPWNENQPPPAIFDIVSKSWGSFVKTLNPLIDLLKNGSQSSYDAATKEWQKRINPDTGKGYSNISFYEGLIQLFVDDYQKYDLEKPWGEEEFALFGALGLGSGGFGPLFQVNFSEIVRLIVNGLETDQRFFPGGLDQLVEGFATSETGYGLVKDRIRYGCKVTKLECEGESAASNVRVTINYGDRREYDAVIVATTTRSMQVDMGLTLPSAQGGITQPPVLDNACNTGLRQLHLMNSSKLFVLTRTKFWKTEGYKHLPSNIQTDELVRGLYCLDYPHTEHGVVLVSYTWGDDSTKYIALKDPNDRFDLLMECLEPFSPEFTNILKDEVMRDHTKLIDWQDQGNYYGAFKLNYPGQDVCNQNLYYQFSRSSNGVYIAGDSISWSGGWIEGALQTGMNAAAAVINQFSPESLFSDSPMTQASQDDQYNYGE